MDNGNGPPARIEISENKDGKLLSQLEWPYYIIEQSHSVCMYACVCVNSLLIGAAGVASFFAHGKMSLFTICGFFHSLQKREKRNASFIIDKNIDVCS